MNNKFLKACGIAALTINRWCAARVARRKTSEESTTHSPPEEEAEPLLGVEDEQFHLRRAEETKDNETPDETYTRTSSTESDHTSLPDNSTPRASTRLPNTPVTEVNSGAAGASNPFNAVYKVVIDKANLILGQARDACADAVATCKKLGFVGIAKAAGRWIEMHPWETAAIVVLLVSLVITPVILSAMGFTSVGIAAGSSAAIIHAGIGNVVAGSAFAIAQSAMMGGYGVFIFGILLAITTTGIGAFAMLKRRWAKRGRNQLALVPYSPGIASKDLGFARQAGYTLALGLLFVIASGVKRWRRWRQNRGYREI